MTDQANADYWALWDALPANERTAHIAKLYEKHGYNPADRRAEVRLERLEQRISDLEHELATLRRQLKKDAEIDADYRHRTRGEQ